MNKKNRIEKLKESFTEDRIKELKEGFRKGDKVTKENIQKLKNIEALEERVRKQEKERIEKLIDKLAQFTCECGCIDFDGKFCERCGKKYKYGEVDYDELVRKLKEEQDKE